MGNTHVSDSSTANSFANLITGVYPSQTTLGDRNILPFYRLHQGQNRFGCRGHCILSRQLGLFYVTLFLLFFLSSLFFAFDARFLCFTLSPAVLIVGAVLFLYVFILLLRTSLSDPGVLPRATRAEVLDFENEHFRRSGQGGDEGEPPQYLRSMVPSLEVTVRGFPYKQVYCHTCLLFRPPRTSHCSVCDNCIERFDHHCPWIGNCVGKRNYRYFVLFLLFSSLYCLYVFAFSVTNIALLYRNSSSLTETLKKSPPSFILIIFTLVLALALFGLFIYHLTLSYREFSTHEDIRRFPKQLHQMGAVNPFSRGNGFANLARVFCGPLPPSSLRAWRLVDPEVMCALPPFSEDVRMPYARHHSSEGNRSVPDARPSLSGQQPKQSVTNRPLELSPSSLVDGDQQRTDWHTQPGGYPREIQSGPRTTNGSVPKQGRRHFVELDEHGDRLPTAGFSGRTVVSVTPTSPTPNQSNG